MISDKSIQYKSGYKYQLHKTANFKLSFLPRITEDVVTEYISLTKDGWLTIRKGYAWDGASGPTYDSKNTMRGSLIHDALYQLIRMKLIPKEIRSDADEELYIVIRQDGMWYIRAKSWHLAVSLCAASAADPKNRRKVLEAP